MDIHFDGPNFPWLGFLVLIKADCNKVLGFVDALNETIYCFINRLTKRFIITLNIIKMFVFSGFT